MTEPLCHCGQPAPSATICARCERALMLALLSAAVLGPELTAAITRQARFTDHPGRGTVTPLPYDERASAAAAALRSELTRWVRAFGGSPDVIAAMAMWLARRMPAIRTHPDAATIHRGVTTTVAQVRRTVDRPPARTYAGPCPACGADLLARPGRAVITCGCGQPSIVADQRAAMRAALEDHLGSAVYCARVATGLGWPTTPERIRQWAHRGHIGQRPGGLYRVGDVLDRVLQRDARQPG